jgi:hypothetical protein
MLVERTPEERAAWRHMNDTLDGYRAGYLTEAEYRQAFDEWAQVARADAAVLRLLKAVQDA